MELKKVCSAGDPILVRGNKRRVDPIPLSLLAVLLQAAATTYLVMADAELGAVCVSGGLTLAYSLGGYALSFKPTRRTTV